MLPAPRHPQASKLGRHAGTALLIFWVALASAAPASAQQLVHRFNDPAFGGNPFYGDYLLGIAAIDRPKQPSEPSNSPSEEELLASQLRAQFLSQLSSDIRSRIQSARAGESGQFEFGDQQIGFTRTSIETQITFTNTRTGEVSRVVLPVSSSSSSTFGIASLSAEQLLSAGGSSPVATAPIN